MTSTDKKKTDRPFKRYPSMNGVWNDKQVNYWLINHPELHDLEYVIQEKVHGANIQFDFVPFEELHIGKRTAFLSENSKFYDFQPEVEKMRVYLGHLQEHCNSTKQPIRLYGEFYGGNIQKGVNYGEEKNFIFYDVVIDGKFLTPENFYVFCIEHGLVNHIVPILGYATGLEEAMAFDVEKDSRLTPLNHIGRNICEGGVIRPMSVNVENRQDPYSIFRLKKKNEAFKEVQRERKPRKPQGIISEEAQKLATEFTRYITPQRVETIFSKHGPIERPNQIGDYIKLVLNDAKEEFFLTYADEFNPLSKEEKKIILNVGKNILVLLKEHL